MWYFAWILGVGFACAFSILNAMWLELHEVSAAKAPVDAELRRSSRY
ncbi:MULTISPECIES: cytochrome bd-I oxidase subunit CydX [Inquilinus]|uniref:Cyd operon protein YbgT n=1 Tax=Inquilinus ginsengisoli TaxID=363840 RepID=A0ABU1JHU2_9PROT|nr:cytochrome bd-I oxidase subunit CydX [Inquilinus ginsengisoli]MDR6288189.1 cyd operon protein YbgT [Inquilinus ginsengisoli]